MAKTSRAKSQDAPTVGRILHYWPPGQRGESDQPQVAIVARVNDDGTCNVMLLDRNGEVVHNPPSGVTLFDGAVKDRPKDGHYLEWPPR